MDTEVKPPDMQGAGGAPQPYPASEAVGLLKSYGSMPAGLFQQPVPNPYAAAISAGMPFVGRPDVVARQTQQALAGQEQAFQQMMQVRREQERRQQVEYAKNKDMLTVYQEFLKSDNPQAKAFAAQGIGSTLKNMGMPVPAAVLEGLGKSRLDVKKLDEITQRLAEGWSPQRLREAYPDVPDAVFAEAQRIVTQPSDALAKSLGIKTAEDRKIQALKTRQEELKAWAAERGIKLDDDTYAVMTQLAKRPLSEMSDADVQLLKGQAERLVADRKLKDKLTEINAKAAIQHKNRLVEIEARAAAQARNKPLLSPALRLQGQKLQAEYAGFPAREQRLQRVKDAVALLDKEGLLPTGPTAADFGLAAVKGATMTNRPEIAAAWDTLQRYGVPLIANAEKELAGQPIGNMLRLKSIAESEIGGIRRVPKQWWQEFFQDYDTGMRGRKDLLEQQMDALGVELPKPPPVPASGKKALSKEQYDQARKRGYTDEEIRAKGYEVPR